MTAIAIGNAVVWACTASHSIAVTTPSAIGVSTPNSSANAMPAFASAIATGGFQIVLLTATSGAAVATVRTTSVATHGEIRRASA